jgi:hypothetical protein
MQLLAVHSAYGLLTMNYRGNVMSFHLSARFIIETTRRVPWEFVVKGLG